MNKLMVVTAATLFAASLNAMSLAEARGMTDKVISDPSEMTSVMKELSAADQKSFVADVNEAISKLPGSVEEKTAKVVNVTRAALKGADRSDRKNLENLIAEVYATAPLESLCAVNENLSKDAFNRAADPKKVYTDDQFTAIATNLVKAVNDRVAGLEDADVRGGFAALTMIRASNGSPENLSDTLADTLGDSAETAKNEWFPEALKTPANYDPMLSGSMAEAPNPKSVQAIAGAERETTLMNEFLSDPVNAMPIVGSMGDMSKITSFDHDIYTRPRTLKDEKWNPDLPVRPEEEEPHPVPYYGQNAGRANF